MCSNRLYAVGGIDSRLTVSTTEYLDLHHGITKYPVQHTTKKQHINKNVGPLIDEEPLLSEWSEVLPTDGAEGMVHGGGTFTITINTSIYALSIYGTLENDKVFDTTHPNARYHIIKQITSFIRLLYTLFVCD